MSFFAQYKELPKQVYFLAISRGAVNMGIMFMFPFLSLLLTSRLGYTEQEASYIIVASSACGIVGNILGGKLSDEFGRKKVYGTAILISIAATTAAGFICNERMVIFPIIIMYFAFNIILPCVSAMILDWSSDNNKTECYSLLYLATNVGGAIGPVIAGLLFYKHMPWIFFSMAIVFIPAAVLLFFGVQDIYTPCRSIQQENTHKQSSQKNKSFLYIILKNPILLLFLACLSILTLCYINLDFTLPLHLKQLFGLNAGSKYSSLVWTVNGITVVLLTPFLILSAKKRSPLSNISIASFLYAAGFSVYILSENALILQCTTIIWTAGEILISTCAGIYIADQCPETHKGRSMALYEFSRSAGKLLGPIFAGFLLSRYSYSMTWFLIVCLCISSGIILRLLYLYTKRNKSL